MYTETKSTTLSANIQFEGTVVVSMYAQKSEVGDINTNINIQSQTLYAAYKDECDEYIATFKKHVEEL